jgi:undecaprenyl-diphosphatase
VDAALFSAVNGAHAPWLDAVMAGASWLGYFPGIWFIGAAAALAWAPLRAAAFRMLLAVSLTYALANGVIKPLVARQRPYLALTSARTVEALPPVSYSFPSGHAATAVAGAIAGARVFPSVSWVLWTLATLMAVSRVYVGVHYPSDLVAGAVLGAACAYFVLGGRHPATWAAISRRSPGPSTAGIRMRP